jgi:5-methylcytosine-specific restriction endonuclease McrBC regulatory subunit McrC
MSKRLIHIKDNCVNGVVVDNPEDVANLSGFLNKSINQLVKEENLLVFPYSLNEYGDELGQQTIGSLQLVDNNAILHSGNIMGFVGTGETQLRISSRFGTDNDDFFLYYMLCRVHSINVFDLPFSQSPDQMLDMLMLLFPYYLSNAMRQGIYKEYRTYHYNNSEARGIIEINRHIQRNVPFQGNIAYRERLKSMENPLTQLIRHTIEYIRNHPMGMAILEHDSDIRAFVAHIENSTPSYCRRERVKIINENLRPKIHPYYSEYRPLQKICLQILMHDEVSMGAESDQIYGLLFDGAWLWEEYLNTILDGVGFIHPRNKVGAHRISLFLDGSGWRYPDFYHPHTKIVLDAKYKRMEYKSHVSDIDRDDVHQVISYMHVLKSQDGGFIYPSQNECHSPQSELLGYGGKIKLFPVHIPQVDNWSDFVSQINHTEDELIEAVKELTF